MHNSLHTIITPNTQVFRTIICLHPLTILYHKKLKHYSTPHTITAWFAMKLITLNYVQRALKGHATEQHLRLKAYADPCGGGGMLMWCGQDMMMFSIMGGLAFMQLWRDKWVVCCGWAFKLWMRNRVWWHPQGAVIAICMRLLSSSDVFVYRVYIVCECDLLI